jgi:Na+/H+-dicarboxylate symporter
MALVLRSVNVPTAAVAILVPFDRILDRLRTVVNVWGDLVCVTLVNNLANTSKKHPSHLKTAVAQPPVFVATSPAVT